MSIWDGFAESLSETWDVVLDVGGEVAKQRLQATAEAATDPNKLSLAEPVKGRNPDGSTVVAAPTQTQVVAPKPQYIQGIDNTIVYVGGAIVSLGLLVMFIKAVK